MLVDMLVGTAEQSVVGILLVVTAVGTTALYVVCVSWIRQ